MRLFRCKNITIKANIEKKALYNKKSGRKAAFSLFLSHRSKVGRRVVLQLAESSGEGGTTGKAGTIRDFRNAERWIGKQKLSIRNTFLGQILIKGKAGGLFKESFEVELTESCIFGHLIQG